MTILLSSFLSSSQTWLDLSENFLGLLWRWKGCLRNVHSFELHICRYRKGHGLPRVSVPTGATRGIIVNVDTSKLQQKATCEQRQQIVSASLIYICYLILLSGNLSLLPLILLPKKHWGLQLIITDDNVCTVHNFEALVPYKSKSSYVILTIQSHPFHKSSAHYFHELVLKYRSLVEANGLSIRCTRSRPNSGPDLVGNVFPEIPVLLHSHKQLRKSPNRLTARKELRWQILSYEGANGLKSLNFRRTAVTRLSLQVVLCDLI